MENTGKKTVAILAAMKQELNILLPYVKIYSRQTECNLPVWKGTLYGNKVVIQLTGIGKVNAAMATQRVISRSEVSHVFNFGVAGGISAKVNIRGVICTTRTIQSDFDLTIFGFKKGQVPEINKYFLPTSYEKTQFRPLQKKYLIKFGAVVSADQFIADRKVVLQIGREFKALAKDMEAAAIGQVCYVNKIPFTAIKGICDGSGESSGTEYKQYLQSSVTSSTRVLLELIKNTGSMND